MEDARIKWRSRSLTKEQREAIRKDGSIVKYEDLICDTETSPEGDIILEISVNGIVNPVTAKQRISKTGLPKFLRAMGVQEVHQLRGKAIDVYVGDLGMKYDAGCGEDGCGFREFYVGMSIPFNN